MRMRGQITVFLSMTLLLIVSLLFGLIESARMAGAVWYMKASADSAMASVFSQYHKQLWEQYRLFFLEYGEKEELTEAWKGYMGPYEEDHGWYPFSVESVDIERLDHAVDSGGDFIRQEILDYMKYGMFEIDQNEDHAKMLLADLQECRAIDRISRSYEGHTKEAVKLEQALEDIYSSLHVQRTLHQSAVEELSRFDGVGFRREAGKLRTEMNRLTKLVDTYRKRADAFAAKVRSTGSAVSEDQVQLREYARQAVNEVYESYASYTDEDGVRRREIEGLIGYRDTGLEVLERAVDHSLEVEEELDSWEESEDGEDNGPDEAALWGSVEAIWHTMEIPGLSFAPGIKDKEKQRILEQIGRLADEGLLAAVMPEGKAISQGMIDGSGVPSALFIEEGESTDSLVDRLFVEEYCSRFFTNVLSEEEKEFLYEQEYLISGKASDRENLAQTVKALLGIREGFNLLHILSDQVKREEARALAFVIAGVAGPTPLAEILAFFVMTIWALGEALMDVKALLEGMAVPLIKSRENWKLSLEALLRMGDRFAAEPCGDADGMDYGAYLKLLMFMEKRENLYYRIMDMIQINLQRQQKDFQMADCVYRIGLQSQMTGRHLFFGGSDGHYLLRVSTEKAY